MKRRFLFITCEEAKHICDKNQYGEATGWERIKLGIRLSWCRITKAYTKNNNKLTEAVQKADINCLKQEERAKMQSEFEKELAQHQ